jgi:type II secretory ATPase GspE/PulE/Tfp pilus assembly ATPase PilB-like protein
MSRLALLESEKETPGERPLPFPELETALVALVGSGEEGAISMVDTLLSQAVLHRASDVHIEPWNDCVAVRYRIDGWLHNVARLPLPHHGRIVGRVKVLARIVTYQKDLPQDGRIDPEASPCGKGMRVSTFPTVYGEKLVIRLLDMDPALFSIDALGFSAPVVAALRSIIARPHGTLLLTGPASSGKTTTIYALLKEILEMRAPSAHVVTLEDPVEYRLGHLAQTEINPYAGFTFDAALRAVIRQDPEVIMLGEIRDKETAHAAIQAGLTGHLVISTIHSGTAAGVFTRLLDMGIEPFLIVSSVTGVLAQRLVRRNCPGCAARYLPDPVLRKRFHLADAEVSFRRGAGCDACQALGYRGRTALGEILTLNAALADLILARSRTHTLGEAAVRAGMVPLVADALDRVREGITTLEEVSRVLTMPEEANQ